MLFPDKFPFYEITVDFLWSHWSIRLWLLIGKINKLEKMNPDWNLFTLCLIV